MAERPAGKALRPIRGIAASGLLLAALACDRGGGSDARSPAPAEGIWNGTFGQAAATAIVDPYQSIYLVALDDFGEPTLGLELWGELRTDGPSVSGWLGHHDSYGGISLDVDGTLAPRATLRLTLHDRADPGSFFDGMQVDLAYDPTWNRGASPAFVQGTWTLDDATLVVGPDDSIDGRGTDGSVYYGQISSEWRDADCYSLSLECYFAGESQPWYFDGVAIERGDGSLLFTLYGVRYGLFGSTYWSDVMRR
jgi:hypothetical protein